MWSRATVVLFPTRTAKLNTYSYKQVYSNHSADLFEDRPLLTFKNKTMTKEEYENALISSPKWERSKWGTLGGMSMVLNKNYNYWPLEEILIPLFQIGLIEGYRQGMFEINRIHAQEWTVIKGSAPHTCLVDVNDFMNHHVSLAFCESILKYL